MSHIVLLTANSGVSVWPFPSLHTRIDPDHARMPLSQLFPRHLFLQNENASTYLARLGLILSRVPFLGLLGRFGDRPGRLAKGLCRGSSRGRHLEGFGCVARLVEFRGRSSTLAAAASRF